MSAKEPSRERKALVVDDDVHIRELLQTLLELVGFEVHLAADGIDVLSLHERYDVILLDLKMPVFDGERLTDYWQMTDPDALQRVIVLSGYSRVARAKQLPTFATIEKPFDHAELLRLVDACLAQQRSAEKRNEQETDR